MSKHMGTVVLFLAFCLFLALGCLYCDDLAAQAGELDTTWYVVVAPDDHLNVRRKASLGAEVTGYLFLGDEVEMDASAGKGAWVHLIGLGTELGEGWVRSDYLSKEEPVVYEQPVERMIVSNGRVALRNYAGERIAWLHSGDQVQVVGESGGWMLLKGGKVRKEWCE